MTKFLAILFLLFLSTLNSIGSMWFAYGFWPINFWVILPFSFSSAILYSTIQHVSKEK